MAIRPRTIAAEGSTPTLTIRFENKQPVELLDLTASFAALGRQYEEFVFSRGYDPQAGNVRLYITELRTGSIIADLKTLSDQASFILDYADVFAGFVANLNDLIRFFLKGELQVTDGITKPEAERLTQIIEPVAKDGGSQLFLNVSGNAKVNVIINSEQANAVQNSIRRFVGPQPKIQGMFEREVLYLYQVRGETKSKAGDRGIIERFSLKPVKLNIMTPEAKAKIIDSKYPFKMAYIVDGQVSTVEGEPALYKIYAVHEVLERP